MNESTSLLNTGISTKRINPYIIFPLYALFQLCNTINTTILPNTFITIVCRSHYKLDLSYNDSRCEHTKIQQTTSSLLAGCGLVTGIMAMIVLPRISCLSDRSGRKSALYYFFACYILYTLSIIFGLKYWNRVGYKSLWAIAFLNGLAGTEICLTTALDSYIADSTKSTDRPKVLRLRTVIALAIWVIGPYIGSIVVKMSNGLIMPFILCIAAQVIAVGWLTLIPESLTETRMGEFKKKFNDLESRNWYLHIFDSINVIRPIQQIWYIAKDKSPIVKQNILLLTFFEIGYLTIMNVRQEILPLYFQKELHWTAVEFGQLSSLTSLVKLLLLLGIIPLMIQLMNKRFFHKDEKHTGEKGIDRSGLYLIRLGIISEIVGSLCFAISKTSLQNYASGLIEVFGAIVRPTLSSTFLNIIPEKELGEFLGSKGSILVISVLTVDTVGELFYSLTVKLMPSLFLLIAAFGFLVVGAITLMIRIDSRKTQRGASLATSAS